MIQSGKIDKGRMYKSPLLKTVQRHTRMAAVTHAPLQMPVAPGVEQEKNLPPERRAEIVLPVKASWVPTPATLGESIPTTPPIPGDREQSSIQPLPEKPVRSTIPGESREVEPAHTAGKDTSPPQNVGEEDTLWRRLQTIFNRHQEKEQQAESLGTVTPPVDEKRTEAQPSEKISKPAEASQTARPTGSTGESDKTAGPVQRKESTPQQKRTDNLTTASMNTGEAATPSIKEFDMQSEGQAGSSSLANQLAPSERPDRESKTAASDQPTPQNPAYQSQAEDQTTPTPHSESLSEIPFPLDDAIITAEARETQIPKSKISLDSYATEAIGSEPENAAEEETADNLDQQEESINLHRSPLQSVWPVQEKATSPEFREASQPPSPTKVDEPAESKGTFTIPEADAHDRTALDQDFGQIQNRLEQVRTTPSDSSIEYIPPRRPRPSSLAEQPAKPADLVQRQFEDENLDIQPVHPAAENRPIETISPFDTTQLSPSVGQEAHTQVPNHKRPITPAQPVQTFKGESGSSGMVGTEFGDLPSDLWQLIGENPPASAAAPPAAIQSPAQSGLEQMRSSATQVMRSPLGSFPGQDENRSYQAQTIQRQTEQTAASDQSAPFSEQAPQEDQEKPADQEVDIQELAKKVYSEIKQKLALEWERRRF